MFAVANCIVQIFLTLRAKYHITVFALDFGRLSASITLLLLFALIVGDDLMKELIISA